MCVVCGCSTHEAEPVVAVDHGDLHYGQGAARVCVPGLSEARTIALEADVLARLLKLAGHRATQDGVIVITAQEFRSQDRNRAAAREGLFDLIRRASVAPIKRRATRPTRSSQRRRVDNKVSRGKIKAARRKQDFD